MPKIDNPATVCPHCKKGSMSMLKRIAHADESVTIYLRCPGCSHLEIVQNQPKGDEHWGPSV